MIQVEPYQNRVHLYHYLDGKVWTFKNVMEASQYAGWIQSVGTVGEHFIKHHENGLSQCYIHNEYILRDDYGEPVSLNHLIWLHNQKFKKKRQPHSYFSGSKRSHSRWYRHMRTTNERRQAYNNYDVYEKYGVVVRPRAKRSGHMLPNNYDDFVRDVEKGWKHHRKHQWIDLPI